MKVISHRGFHESYPENSIEAFEKALEIGADALETDVLLTKDKKLILRHDDFIWRDDKCLKISNLTLDELQGILDENGSKVTTLNEFLERFGERSKLVLDLKHRTFESLKNTLKTFPFKENVHLTSFIHQEVVDFKKEFPEISRSYIFAASPVSFAGWEKYFEGCEVSLCRSYLNVDHLKFFKENGVEVRVYTVNDLDDASNLARLGVSAVFSDRIDLLQSIRDCH